MSMFAWQSPCKLPRGHGVPTLRFTILAAGATRGPASVNQNRGRRSSNAAEASANNQKLLFKPTHTRRPSPTVL